MKNRATTELVIDDLQARPDFVATQVDARAIGTRRGGATLATFEALLPDITNECRLFEDCASTVYIAAHEAIATGCDVKGV